MWGPIKVPGGECDSMHLGSQFLFPQKVDESIYFGVHPLSTMSIQHTRHMYINSHQKEHDITGASCSDIRYHVMMFP